jgi:hypothetical protein
MNDSIKTHISALEKCYTYIFTKKNSIENIRNLEKLHSHAQSILSVTADMIKQRKSDNTTILPQKQVYAINTVCSDKYINACYM